MEAATFGHERPGGYLHNLSNLPKTHLGMGVLAGAFREVDGEVWPSCIKHPAAQLQ